jgi:hypothetical protein
MKKVIAVTIGLVALPAGVGRGQYNDNDTDYSDHFGWEDTPSGAEGGPSSVAEAKLQGRGYRIGQHGPRAEGGADVHVVAEGDTLWDISAHYFDDPWHWPQIWSWNPEVTNPHWIYPLDQIRLSSEKLTADQVVAHAKVGGGGPGGFGERGANAGVLAGTEVAPNVVVPREAFTPGVVFLRDQGYLDAESLRTAGQIMGGHAENMFLSPTDQVYVRFKSDQDVRAGQSYTIFRAIKPEEREEAEQGVLVRVLGTIAVRTYDRNKRIARGVITESMEPIERGMFVAQVDRRFDLVAPKRNASNVVAHIIASVQPRRLISYGNVVFLDVGEGKGIQPGNRFFVVRRGDDWLDTIDAEPTEIGNVTEVPPYDKQELPKEVVAELLVVKVRKKTTIAIITRSDTDLELGDTAEMRTGF